MAGFKYKKFSFAGGSAEFPSGIRASDIQTKERAIVKGFADALIAMNIGWGCDTTRNATTSDFVDVPKYSSSTPAPGLFLINATSGCKLFIAYVDDGNTENCGMALYDSDGTTKLMPANDYVVCRYNLHINGKPLSLSGFIMSMIPAGSTNSFGSTFKASEFLPADATRLWSSAANIAYNYGNNSYSSFPYIITRCDSNAITVSALATPYCVGYGCGYDTQFRGFMYAVGRIMGDLANPTADTSNQSKYGVVTLYACGSNSSLTAEYNTRAEFDYYYSSNYSSWVHSLTTLSQYYSNGPKTVFGFGYQSYDYINYESFYSSSSYVNKYGLFGFCVCRADGTWVSRANNKFVAPHVDGVRLASVVYDSTSNNRPWVPIGMYLFNVNQDNDCIYNGDCFKGYLDTDLFRCSPQFTAGTVMDNGNFVCTGEACLTLGWDPSNESW